VFHAQSNQTAERLLRQVKNPEPSRAESRSVLRRHSAERRLQLCDGIIDIAAALFSLPGRELRRGGRTASDISRVRQIAMYVAHVALGMTMREVGLGFGRDRTTVLHACHLVEDMRDDAEFDRIVAVFEKVAAAALRAGEDA